MAEVMIGLETHVQLDTETKLFCSCPNTEAAAPNTHTCDTCLGLPGSKPRTNEAAIEYALQVGLALNCDIADGVDFSRKTYFYPDMSKNYQITQYEGPIAEHGHVPIQGQTIGITRVHLEEDPARLVHQGGSMETATYTQVDYNRAGTPLIEIVTEPDIETPEQARLFLQKLTRILEYLQVYDAENGTVKSDANISVNGGNRVEVKNITGTKAIEAALAHELQRQQRLQRNGKTVTRETRHWDDEQERTVSVRIKETEADYGYLREPDLVTVPLPAEQVQETRDSLPELPDEKRERFLTEHGIEAELADSLITDPSLAASFEEAVDAVGADLAASWFSGPIKKTLNYHDLTYAESPLRADWIVTVLTKLADDELSDQAAETVIRELVEHPRDPENIIAEKGLEKAGGSELAAWVDDAIDENPDAVEDVESGDAGAINFLVGQVMQKSGGSADPKEARELLEQRLGN